MNVLWREVGKLWEIDEEGYIVNDASLAKIVPPFTDLVAALCDAYLKYLPGKIHSIYLRGSIARGLGVEGLSDLDNFAVTKDDLAGLDLSWGKAAAGELLQRFPFVTSLGFDLEHYEDIVLNDGCFYETHLLMQTQSVCLYGEDLIPQLPRFKPGIAVANCDICQIRPDIEEAIDEIRANPSPDYTRFWCRRIMKNIVRAGFSLVMLEEKAFTRDLQPCFHYFSKHFPGQEPEMRQAVEWVINPSDNARAVLQFLKTFGGWLINAADTWLERYNPSKELALPFDS